MIRIFSMILEALDNAFSYNKKYDDTFYDQEEEELLCKSFEAGLKRCNPF